MTHRMNTEALQELLSAILAGPWGVYSADTPQPEDAKVELARLVDGTEDFSGKVHQVADFNGNAIAVTGCGPKGLIHAHALHHLPELVAEVLELRAMRDAVEQTKAEVDTRLKARGMVSVDQLVKPFSPFQIHAGMSDLGFFREWLTRKATEYAQLRAKREVKNETDDDMYEWLLGKSAAYADILANLNAATAQGDRV